MVAALVAALGFGAIAVAIRWALGRSPDPQAGAVAITSTAAVGAVAVAAASEPVMPPAAVLVALVLGGALAPGLAQGAFVRAVRAAGPTRATIVSNTFPLFSAVIAIRALGEPFRPVLVLATVTIVLGGALLAWERARPEGFRRTGVVLALVCALLFAGRDNLVRSAMRGGEVPAAEAAAISIVAAAVTAFLVFAASARGTGAAHRLRSAWLAFLPAAACLFVAYQGLVTALSRGLVVVVAPLVATQTLWAIVFATLLLGRSREGIGARLVLAALLIAIGSTIVGVSR